MLSSVIRSVSNILLDGKPELTFPAVALVDVKRLVLIVGHDHILGIDRAAEELDSIVGVVVHFDIFDRSSGSNRTKG